MMNAKDDMTSPRQTFHKALMLLDRGSTARGEALLRDVIGEAEARHDDVVLVQGLVCLSELLCEAGRAGEARPLLERALAIRRDDDGLAVEFERAKALLSGRGRRKRDE
jgi:hypothetical protein